MLNKSKKDPLATLPLKNIGSKNNQNIQRPKKLELKNHRGEKS